LTDDVPAQADLQEALYELRQYLSDRLAPLMVLDSITVLLGLPARVMADEIAGWSASQAQLQSGAVPFTDYLFHAVRKIHLMEEFQLIPAPELDAFLADLVPAVLEHCPPEHRERLRQSFGKIGQARPTAQDRVEILYRQADGGDLRAAQTPAATPTVSVTNALSDAMQDLRRLPLILERLERQPSTGSFPVAAPGAPPASATAGVPGTTPAAAAPVGGGALLSPRTALLAEAILEAALRSKSGAELDTYIDRIRQRGGAKNTEEMFRALGQSLSGWLLPTVAGAPPLPEGEQVSAMRRMIALPEDPAEGARRFREMVHAAIEQFNGGAWGRAVKMFDLADQMVAEGKVKALFVEPMVNTGHEYLSPDRLKKLAESPDKHSYLRPVLRFFRAFTPERLLDELQVEARRDRRRMLLTLLEIQGDEGRASAYGRLVADPGGTQTDVYLMRNVVSLLRTIARRDETPWPYDEEVARVAGLLRPGVPLLLMKEVFQYLGQAKHEKAEKALISFLAGIERALLPLSLDPEDRQALMIQADRVCSALVRAGTASARWAVVEHALQRTPALGDTLARLGELGRQDLSQTPEIAGRLMEAIRADLPRGVLSRLVPMREAELRRLVGALAGTPSREVRELLSMLAEKFPAEGYGKEAQRALDAQAAPARAPSVPASLSGDLDLFGLPMLLQSLADAKRTGTLTLLDRQGKPVATLRLENGLYRGGTLGPVVGREALYQLIERPFDGTFAFVGRLDPQAEAADQEPVMNVILEGVRRHDHFQRGLALVPEDTPLVATGKSPSTVPNEPEYQVVVKLWEKSCAGKTPRQCESELGVDSYRVWNALAHWVEEGALKLKA
jgi:hypothetical protein